MATEAILSDVGMLYKRLFNHRPIIQNELHYFVRELETKRGEDGDLRTLQDSMSKADEINTVFLNEIACSVPHFNKIRQKSCVIKDTCEKLLGQEDSDLWISPEEQARLDQKVEEYRVELKKKEQDIFTMNEQEIKKLKEEIDELRESRSKLRSHVSSVSSTSVTVYPATPSPELEGYPATPSPELEGEEPQEVELGVESSLEEGGQLEEEKEGTTEVETVSDDGRDSQ